MLSSSVSPVTGATDPTAYAFRVIQDTALAAPLSATDESQGAGRNIFSGSGWLESVFGGAEIAACRLVSGRQARGDSESGPNLRSECRCLGCGGGG